MDVIFFDERVKRFVHDLPMPASARVSRTMELLDQYGHTLGMPYSKPLGKGLFELRMRGQQEIRLLYIFHKGMAMLLHGFIKKSDHIPQKELEIARRKLFTIDDV